MKLLWVMGVGVIICAHFLDLCAYKRSLPQPINPIKEMSFLYASHALGLPLETVKGLTIIKEEELEKSTITKRMSESLEAYTAHMVNGDVLYAEKLLLKFGINCDLLVATKHPGMIILPLDTSYFELLKRKWVQSENGIASNINMQDISFTLAAVTLQIPVKQIHTLRDILPQAIERIKKKKAFEGEYYTGYSTGNKISALYYAHGPLKGIKHCLLWINKGNIPVSIPLKDTYFDVLKGKFNDVTRRKELIIHMNKKLEGLKKKTEEYLLHRQDEKEKKKIPSASSNSAQVNLASQYIITECASPTVALRSGSHALYRNEASSD